MNFKTTVVRILPSYALRLSNTVKKLGIDGCKKDLHLRIFFIGAEPHSKAMRKEIQINR